MVYMTTSDNVDNNNKTISSSEAIIATESLKMFLINNLVLARDIGDDDHFDRYILPPLARANETHDNVTVEAGRLTRITFEQLVNSVPVVPTLLPKYSSCQLLLPNDTLVDLKETNALATAQYSYDEFLFRILRCTYEWLRDDEKGKCKNKNKSEVRVNEADMKEERHILTEQEVASLAPHRDTYQSYDAYLATMFPLLLAETWQEICRDWRGEKSALDDNDDDDASGERDLTAAAHNPLWVVAIDKSRLHNDLAILTCQTAIDQNSKPSPSKDDLIRLTLKVRHELTNAPVVLNLFGIVFMVNRHRKGSFRKIKQVKDFIQDYNDKLADNNNYDRQGKLVAYELAIYVRCRNYSTDMTSCIDYEIVTNLTSNLRRAEALIAFERSPLQNTILSGSSDDRVFWPDTKHIEHACAEFLLANDMKEFNERQAKVILEASSLIHSPPHKPKLYFIQGPPGTGKSHTIVGIVDAMFARFKMCERARHVFCQGEASRMKLLICAPSNGGCDELARRINAWNKRKGNAACASHKSALDVVRVGRAEKVHDDCHEITLDYLVERSILEQRARTASSPNDQARLHWQQQQQRRQPTHQDNNNNKKSNKKSNNKPFTSSIDRREFYDHANRILSEADIIICTLNFSGSTLFDFLIEKPRESGGLEVPTFNAIIVDEAAQCLELESLIPLRFSCNKIIQVGDPEQLPATVLSQIAQENGFGTSLFERTYRRFGGGVGGGGDGSVSTNSPIHMLYEQFRMHPDICVFPSQNFYDGRLITAEAKKATKDGSPFGKLEPYLMFDIQASVEILDEQNESMYNPTEAELVLKMCQTLVKKLKFNSYSIGIISPYQSQVKLLRSMLDKNHLSHVETGTVDGYQGREKDIILFSTVRANNPNKSIGFLVNQQRLNVSITRAKHALYIFCHTKSLRVNRNWQNCIDNAQTRDIIVPIKKTESINFQEQILVAKNNAIKQCNNAKSKHRRHWKKY